MSGGSKFAGLFPTTDAGETAADIQTAETPKVQKSRSSARRKSESPEVVNLSTLPEKRMGRPPGKKSSANHRQVTVYLPVDLHEQGREVVFRSRGETDFSELVEAALRAYLTERFGTP